MDSVLSEKQGMILSLLAIQCTNRIMIYFTCTFTMDYPNESLSLITFPQKLSFTQIMKKTKILQ